MLHDIKSNKLMAITELKANPMRVLEESDEIPIAILNKSKPVFYCVPLGVFHKLLADLEEAQDTIEAYKSEKRWRKNCSRY